MPPNVTFRPPIVFHTNALTLLASFEPWDLPRMARWAVNNGFAGLEVGPGVALERAAFDQARSEGATISCLTYGRNVLADDPVERATHQRNVVNRLRFAGESGIPLVVLATGRASGRNLRANLPSVVQWLGETVLPLAREGGVTVAIENCPAVGNIATSPAMWRELLDGELASDDLCLGFDASHLVWQMVDPYAALHEFTGKVAHVHVKDTLLERSVLAQEGIDGEGWWRYVLPGRGELDWRRIVDELRRSDYRGSLSIEHEDETWLGSESDVLTSLTFSRQYLEQCLE
jgi:sugar phosphate isomerase/epimerase